MSPNLLRFAIYLLLILAVSFFIQFLFFKNLITILIVNYVLNFFLAIFICAAYFYFYALKMNIEGFVFMGGSLLKLMAYFIFILPLFKQDGEFTKSEFSLFFIPYFLCLFFEVFWIANSLNKQ